MFSAAAIARAVPSIRDIEKRIQNIEHDNAVRVPVSAPAASVPDDFSEHSRLMFDLMALAFQTDMTRVVTVLLAIEQSPRNYPEIGITEGHHGLTHHQGDKEKIEKVTQIHDHKGTLIVFWNAAPSDEEKEFFAQAWASKIGDGSRNVEHEF